MMDNGSPDSEKQGKHLHFRREVGGFEAGGLKTEKVQHGVARDFKQAEDVSAPRAVGKVLEGIVTIVTEGAGLCLVEAIE